MSQKEVFCRFSDQHILHIMCFEAVGDQVQGFALRIFLEFNFFGLFGQMSGI